MYFRFIKKTCIYLRETKLDFSLEIYLLAMLRLILSNNNIGDIGTQSLH
jgi:hypothetical protein